MTRTLQDLGLVQIHDRYGNTLFVEQTQLDNPKRILLRLYRRNGKRLLERATHEWQGRYQVLHRGNICPHSLREFRTGILLGDSVRYCPQCEPNFPGGQ
jgi:hypothetical protein